MKILDRLPITETRAPLRFGGRYATVHRNQILVWVSVHVDGTFDPEENIPRFPALVDTGNNFDFSIRDEQLRDWAGINPGLLLLLGDATINGQAVKRRRATVWLYPNIPGSQEVASDRPPFRLQLKRGIAVYKCEAVPTGPRLPLLGLPAFLGSNLDWWLDSERRRLTVQPLTWRRPLILLLCSV